MANKFFEFLLAHAFDELAVSRGELLSVADRVAIGHGVVSEDTAVQECYGLAFFAFHGVQLDGSEFTPRGREMAISLRTEWLSLD